MPVKISDQAPNPGMNAMASIRQHENNTASQRTRYLKIDPWLPDPYTTLWVSNLEDAIPFRAECDAQAVKGHVSDASRVIKATNGFFYVAR